MLGLGTLSFQSNWAIENSGICPHPYNHDHNVSRHRHKRSRNVSAKQQQRLQLWPVHSSLDFAGTTTSPLPNVLHELTLPPSQQLLALGYEPPLTFLQSSSSKIIDLAGGQDSTTTIAVESKTVFALKNSSSSDERHLQRSQSRFLRSSPGRNLWRSSESSSSSSSSSTFSTVRGDTKIRELDRVRVSRSSQESSQEDKQDNDRERYGEFEAPPASNWDDSNAEDIPRRKFKRSAFYSPQDAEDYPSSRSSFQGMGNSGPSSSRRGDGEWDYESFSQGSSREPRGASQGSWAWWSRTRNDDRFDYDDEGADEDEDEDEDEEEKPSWSSWLKLDLKDTLTLMRWGLPAAFILGAAVIPTMLSNPLLLLLGFSFFPSAAKVVNPLAKQFFRSVGNSFGDSSTTRKKKRGNRSARGWSRPGSAYRDQSTPRYDDAYGSPPPPPPRETSRSYDAALYRDQQQRSTSAYNDYGSPPREGEAGTRYDFDVPRQEVSLDTPRLGGWDDLVDDRSRVKASGLWPLGKKPTSARMVARRDQPLYIRIILALFPFLRGWGGLL